MKSSHLWNLFRNKRGEISTILIFIGMAIIALGILVGSQIQNNRVSTQSRAATIIDPLWAGAKPSSTGVYLWTNGGPTTGWDSVLGNRAYICNGQFCWVLDRSTNPPTFLNSGNPFTMSTNPEYNVAAAPDGTKPWSNGGPTAAWSWGVNYNGRIEQETMLCSRNYCWRYIRYADGSGFWRDGGAPIHLPTANSFWSDSRVAGLWSGNGLTVGWTDTVNNKATLCNGSYCWSLNYSTWTWLGQISPVPAPPGKSVSQYTSGWTSPATKIITLCYTNICYQYNPNTGTWSSDTYIIGLQPTNTPIPSPTPNARPGNTIISVDGSTSSSIRPDGATRHTFRLYSTDANGGNTITEQLIILNHQGPSAGQYRGYVGWSLDTNFQHFGGAVADVVACTGTGGGRAAKHSSSTYGAGYIDIISCNSYVSQNQRVFEVIVTFMPFTTPTSNTISAYAEDTTTANTNWNQFGTLTLILPTNTPTPTRPPVPTATPTAIPIAAFTTNPARPKENTSSMIYITAAASAIPSTSNRITITNSAGQIVVNNVAMNRTVFGTNNSSVRIDYMFTLPAGTYTARVTLFNGQVHTTTFTVYPPIVTVTENTVSPNPGTPTTPINFAVRANTNGFVMNGTMTVRQGTTVIVNAAAMTQENVADGSQRVRYSRTFAPGAYTYTVNLTTSSGLKTATGTATGSFSVPAPTATITPTRTPTPTPTVNTCVPILTNPLNNAAMTTNPAFQWTMCGIQARYQLVVKQGATVIDSVITSNTAYGFLQPKWQNNTTYTWTVKVCLNPDCVGGTPSAARTFIYNPAPTVTMTPTPTATRTPTPTIPYCSLYAKGDINCDNNVDTLDFTCWRYEFANGSKANGCPRTADINNINGVDLLDFTIWKLNVGASL